MLVKELGPDTPIIQTIFNPLSQAKNLVGGAELLVHLRRYPEAVHAGLKVIVESTQRFIEAVKETGVAGIFYAVQHAQYGLLSEAEYNSFGRPYDLQVLEPAQEHVAAHAAPAWNGCDVRPVHRLPGQYLELARP